MSEQYRRAARLTVGPEPNTGLVVDSRFRISFSVSQTEDEDANNVSVNIYGLNDESRALLNQENQVLLLEAGYGDQTEVLTIAEIKRVMIAREFPGIMSTIEATDGGTSLSQIRLSLSFSENYSLQDALQKIATDSGLPIRLASNLNLNIPYQTGAAFTGTLRSILNEVTKRQPGLRWNITDGEILIFNNQSQNLQSRVVLNPQTGLIESPSRIEQEEDEQDAVRIVSLLQPRIRPGTEIQLNSLDFDGLYKVKRVEHVGDTRTGDWVSISECEEL